MPPLNTAISYSGSKLQFYTKQECEQWLSGRERVKPDEDPENGLERLPYPERRSFYYVAHWIATQLTYRDANSRMDDRMGHLAERREFAFVLQTAAELP